MLCDSTGIRVLNTLNGYCGSEKNTVTEETYSVNLLVHE